MPYTAAVEVAEGEIVDAMVGGGSREAVALVEHGSRTTYGELTQRVGRRADELDLPPRSLVVLPMSNTPSR